MKIFRISALAALALGTAVLGFSQETKTLPAGKPVVSEVGHGMAIAPGRIAITGENLGLVRTVRLDGVEVPVVRNTGTRLVIEPAPGMPGFHALALEHGQGTVERVLELTPTLAARRAGEYLAVSVHGSDRGWYELSYSLKLAPAPQYYPGINFPNLLDLATPYSGLAYGAYLPDGDRSTMLWRVPPMMAVTTPVHIQALCESLDGVLCYSNAVTVRPGFLLEDTLR